jgi:hypothetical protein
MSRIIKIILGVVYTMQRKVTDFFSNQWKAFKPVLIFEAREMLAKFILGVLISLGGIALDVNGFFDFLDPACEVSTFI